MVPALEPCFVVSWHVHPDDPDMPVTVHRVWQKKMLPARSRAHMVVVSTAIHGNNRACANRKTSILANRNTAPSGKAISTL